MPKVIIQQIPYAINLTLFSVNVWIHVLTVVQVQGTCGTCTHRRGELHN